MSSISSTQWNHPEALPIYPLYVPLIDAPKWFSISRDTIYRAAKREQIVIYKVGGRSLVKFCEIEEWIQNGKNHQNPKWG